MNRNRNATPRVSGRRWVLIGLVVVLLLSAFIMVRIVQLSGPGPDPETIPERPGTSGP